LFISSQIINIAVPEKGHGPIAQQVRASRLKVGRVAGTKLKEGSIKEGYNYTDKNIKVP